MATILKPFSNFILVKPIEIANTTASGLALPDTAVDKPNQGDVVAAGEGMYSNNGELIPSSAKVGDRVLFPKYSGTELKLDGVKYLLMRDTDLFGVLERSEQ